MSGPPQKQAARGSRPAILRPAGEPKIARFGEAAQNCIVQPLFTRSVMRRLLLGIVLLVALAGAGFLYWYTRPLPVLTVTSWAGAYGRAQAAAQMRPYAADRRVDVHIAQWDGDLAEVEKAVATHTYKGDVIDFELPKAIEACRKGLLEPFDAASL